MNKVTDINEYRAKKLVGEYERRHDLTLESFSEAFEANRHSYTPTDYEIWNRSMKELYKQKSWAHLEIQEKPEGWRRITPIECLKIAGMVFLGLCVVMIAAYSLSGA